MSETVLTKLIEIRDKYNEVVNADEFDQSKSWEFYSNYKPLRISVTNAVERYRGSPRGETIEPIFETEPSGDYFAIEIEGSKDFAVVPRPRMAYQRHSHESGAMGEVFKTSGFELPLRYYKVKAVIPALFEPDSVRQKWKLTEKGELDLGIGE